MRTSLSTLLLGAFVLATPAALAAPEPTPLCDGVKKPTDGDQDPDKASSEPLCDGVKKPTDGDQDPDKASSEPLCDGVKKPTDGDDAPPKS